MQLNQKGITLIEILVTLAISIIGIVGLSTLQVQTHRAVNDSGNRSQAIWLLEDLTNRIHLNAAAAANYDGNQANVCNSAPTRVCSPYHNGNSVVNAVSCNGSEMATWDLYESLCDMNSIVAGSDVTKSSPATAIANPELTVVVDSANNNETTLTLKWDSRTEAENADGTKVYITDENLTGSSNNSTITYKASLTTVFIP
ncbi:type IV pilus modification PilV family protein [Bacterioplanoides sp.]|uniref:type IV pilus modification PilV family protein n=1 Tax=Bacterioplanoides sp. TaxID=2066072 RepID=UPI003B00D677